MKRLTYILLCLFLFSCRPTEIDRINELVNHWQGRAIQFPKDMTFVSYSKEYGAQRVSLHAEGYRILTFADSLGCMSCKLQLPKWSEFIREVDSVSHRTIPFIFVLQAHKPDEMIYILKRSGFSYPVYIDSKDSLNQLNHFPTEMAYQTFLLDKENRVVAIGNPIYNSSVKKLYMDIIQGKELAVEKNSKKEVLTKAKVAQTVVDLGRFTWEEEQKAVFIIENVGGHPLVIHNVVTSCGCISVDYSQEPVRPGKGVTLKISYKADQPEYIDKILTVYLNADLSPITLRVKGNAVE